MTQENVVYIFNNQKPAISRFETRHENVKNFPSLLTLVKFASAIGYKLKIKLASLKKSFNALATKWNAKNPKAKVTLVK